MTLNIQSVNLILQKFIEIPKLTNLLRSSAVEVTTLVFAVKKVHRLYQPLRAIGSFII